MMTMMNMSTSHTVTCQQGIEESLLSGLCAQVACTKACHHGSSRSNVQSIAALHLEHTSSGATSANASGDTVLSLSLILPS